MNPSLDTSRRQFIKLVTTGSLAMLCDGKWSTDRVLADIGSEFTSTDGWLRLRLGDYAALSETNGSIRIGLNPLRSNHQPNGSFHPIIVNRLPGGDLIALSAECSHASCAVRTFSQSANAHVCPCHGSRFALDGRRLSGPAPFGLDRYELRLIEDQFLEIQVPRLGFTVNGCLEHWAAGTSLKLEFPARQSVSYEVVRKTNVDSEWQTIPFATEAAAIADQTEYSGSNNIAALYVSTEGDQGFYGVRVRIQDL